MASFRPTKIAKKGDAMLDLAFAMDCTASMDPYIIEARDNIIQIVNEIVESENCDVRLALVEYRDHPPADDSFITKKHDFTDSAGTMKAWLRECSAAGGGDIPEAVADALNELVSLSWRKEATKICVFITDAPPHGLGAYRDKFPEGCPIGLDPMEISRKLAAKGISVYVAGCEPSILAYKDFYLAVAHITGGQYVPLEEAQGLVKIIVYGSREEMSLKKFESEVEKEINTLKMSGRKVTEDELTTVLHERWKTRGEQTKQLTLNQRGLATAKSSATAMDITKMEFDAVKTLYKTTTPSSRKARGSAEEPDDNIDNGKGGVSPEDDADVKAKIAMATTALAELETKTKNRSGSPIKVDFSGLTNTVDFGASGSSEQSDHPTAGADKKRSVSNSVKGEYQCIDGGVTLSQTMRLVQKSMMKMSIIDPAGS